MRFLVGEGPRIDVAIVEMFAFVAPRSGPGPRLNDEVVGLFKVLAIVGGIRVVEELLAARAAHPSGDEASLRDQIDFGEFFGHAQRMLQYRQRIADEQDVRFLGEPGEDPASTFITLPMQNGLP